MIPNDLITMLLLLLSSKDIGKHKRAKLVQSVASVWKIATIKIIGELFQVKMIHYVFGEKHVDFCEVHYYLYKKAAMFAKLCENIERKQKFQKCQK